MPIIAGPKDRTNPKGVAAMIVDSMTGKEQAGPEGEGYEGHFLARQLLAAVESKDEKRVYLAFKALFQHCEMEPHEEYGEENEGE
jgi:hypothetical protein